MSGVRLLICLLASAVMANVHGQQCRPLNDSAVLVDFYGATKGINWKVKWDLNKPMKTWQGVSVNSSGCVTGLELSNNNLQGSITDLDLPYLQTLDLSGNNILSNLPPFSKLTSLKTLRISGNRFRGSLPSLANSVELEELDAHDNQFDGPIPDYSKMKDLRILNLSNNSLSGNIGVITHWTSLTHLYLNNNQFQGSIPPVLDMADLVDIDLSRNRLTGNLPSLDDHTKLKRVNFSDNTLSGSFVWPKNVPELETLELSDNLLSDTIPNTGPVGKLKRFFASNNQFTGHVPQMDLPQLESLLLDQNQLTGTIPDFTSLPNLDQFSFRHNNLENIGFEPAFLNQITFCDVSENRMTFQDLVPFRYYRGTTINLFPQKKIAFKTSSFTVTKGNNYKIELDTDEDHGNTEFQWFKDGQRLPVGRTSSFTISNVIPRDAGIYTVTMANSHFPGFPIMSGEFEFLVHCPLVIEERTVYLCPGEEFTFKGFTYNRDTSFADTVLSHNDFVCDSLYLFEVVSYFPDSVHAATELCEGEIYYFGPDSIELTRSGIYLDTFPNIGGCDSIVLLDLTFRDSYRQNVDMGICPGDSLLFKDSVYYEDVDLVDSFTSVFGCDSLVYLRVRFSDPVRTTTRFNICEGDSVLINGEFFNTSMSWTDTLVARAGCDSISTVEVVIRKKYEETQDIFLCSPEAYEWQGMVLHESGFYTDTLQSIYGCDSILNLNLTISPSYFLRDTISICPGDSILFNGTWLTGAGIYFSERKTQAGCDSMNVLVIETHDFAEKWWTSEVCQGDTVLFNGKSYVEPGIYLDTLESVISCDTIVTIEINHIELEIADSTIVGAGTDDSTGSIVVEIGGGHGPYNFQWSTGDSTASLDSVPPGTYTLEVSDAIGCTGVFEFTVPLMTFVQPSTEYKKWVSLRPNFLDRGRASMVKFDIHDDIRLAEISLYNEMGMVIETRKKDFLQHGMSMEWKLGNIPAGMYYFHIREEGKKPIQVMRLVVF